MDVKQRSGESRSRRCGRCALVAAVFYALLPTAAPGLSAPAAEESVRRVLTMLAAAGDDYREGVADGRVVRAIELEEAKAFLEEAAGRLDTMPLDTPARQALATLLAETSAAVGTLAPADAVTEKLAVLRQRLAAATGVGEQIAPPQAPSMERGAGLFRENCVTCHGERGDGKGPAAAGLQPPPANFTDPQFMRAETPSDFYHVISLGKRNTGMAAWDEALSVQDRWDLVSYLWTLRAQRAGLAQGQGIYLGHCAGCHGVTGTGQGTFAPVLLAPAPNLSHPQALARQSDDDLFAAISEGTPGTPMPGFARSLSEEERWNAVAFVRLLSLGGPSRPPAAPGGQAAGGPAAPASGNPVDTALAESGRLLDAAVVAYGRGEAAASSLASDAYLEFEPLERQLGGTAPALRTRVEERFLQLRLALRTPDNAAAVQTGAAAIRADYTAVRDALRPHTSPYALFIESATIILREGFEMVLVIGALVAYVTKAGQAGMRRAVYGGTAAGVLASLGTAVVLGEVLRRNPGSADTLEGLTMLLAAVVLFWVSYWLISKAEADRWQRYIRGKVTTALSGGSYLALAGAAFLAVYREGFETVLFYQALYASAPTASVTVTAGFVAGAILLGCVYALFRRFHVQIPIGQFFFVTGLFLYLMAAIFAGQGVHELQEVGLVPLTALPALPTLPLLGIYPSVESLGLQAVLVALFAYATAVTLRRRRTAALPGGRHDTVTELQALRVAVETLRSELAQFRRGASTAAVAALGEQLQGAVQRVEAIAETTADPARGRPGVSGH